jgi:thiol-disulfide isomerase/thioredoxin
MNNSGASIITNAGALLFALAMWPRAHAAPVPIAELRANGVFQFPQKEARVLCDNADLRFSVWNNQEYLFAQAVLWNDGDSSRRKSGDREIGDWSEVMLDVDADGKPTSRLDRDYLLNPWPNQAGLHYQTCLREGIKTSIEGDSKGKGAIRYVDVSNERRVRVDTYLIPMAEISRHVGNKIRLCYWGYSPKPALIVNSVGYTNEAKVYYGYDIPLSQYQDYVLGKGGELDSTKVPEDRTVIELSQQIDATILEVGQLGPEISARDWVNVHTPVLVKPLTVANLRGKVVLMEFWETWCGPCVEVIPRLNELNHKYSGKNFQLLSFVREGHQTVDKFLNSVPVEYFIGLESDGFEAYGIGQIPYAFVLDRDGRVVWQGHPAEQQMEEAIAGALNSEQSRSSHS